MRKTALHVLLLTGLVLAGFLFSRSQQQPVTGASLAQLFREAQELYDRATAISQSAAYGAAEEKKEEAYNKAALVKFQGLFRQIPLGGGYDSLRFFTAYRIGELQHYFENGTEAIRFYRAAVEAQKKSGLADTLLFKPYLYSGILYYNQNRFDSAMLLFKLAEERQRSASARLQESERLYNVLGVLYYERGNYRQAENYFRKAIEVLNPQHEAYRTLSVNYHINLAQIYLRLEEYDKANTIYQKLLPLNSMTNEIYHNMGSLNLSLGAADKALSYFRKVTPGYNKVIRLYNSMGNAFFTKKQYDSALVYYNKVMGTYQSLPKQSDPVGYGLVLKSMGDYELHFQRPDRALDYYQQALHQFYPAYTATDVRQNPEEFSGVFSYIQLFHTLLAKANAWKALYQQRALLAEAQQELASYQSAFKLIAYVERTYDSDEARLFLARIKYAVHIRPIDLSFDLYTQTKDRRYLENLYFFDQQNKATALALSRQVSGAATIVNAPLLQQEQEIKANISRYAIRAAQVTDSAQLAGLNQQIRDNEILLSKVQDRLNEQGALKETDIPPIASLQKNILEKTSALLSYHLSDDKLTLLLVTKDSVTCFQRPLPPGFSEGMTAYIASLQHPLERGKGNTGYDRLLFDGVPLQRLKQVILIPDDVLNYLPFESIRDSKGRYLVEDVAVQYQYSTTLLKKGDNRFRGREALSFAPFAGRSSSESFPQLASSKGEIEGITGKQFLDSAATKSRFLQLCASYKILHLATHAVVNSQHENLSFIAFSPTEKDNLLYAQEIYNLPLRNTDLVILSACETSAGQLVKGEGVMSLSRAFRYAGCANVITTLWKANDFSTAYLTTRIHRYLSDGLSIAGAVQRAKKDYLADKTIHPRLKHPFYWSHLVFIGDVQENRTVSWLWFVPGGLLFLGLLFLWRKKSRRAGP